MNCQALPADAAIPQFLLRCPHLFDQLLEPLNVFDLVPKLPGPENG